MSLIKGVRDCLKLEMNKWGMNFAFKDEQSRPATTTDTCPDVHLHRMLGLGFIAWLSSSLVVACAPASFHLHSCLICKGNILKGLNSEETTQLRRMTTWEKGPATEPRTCDLCPNAEFQPREPRNRSRSFVPHRHLCASHGCAESTTA